MDDAKSVEFYIWRLSKKGMELSVIADELLKLWNAGKLSIPAKISAGRFCILNGFVVSLISSLRKDLKKGLPVCWPLVFHSSVTFEKTFLDAFLVGATQDGMLAGLAIAALEKENPDPRWAKILKQEIAERMKTLIASKQAQIEELKIYEHEKMYEQGSALIKKLRTLFPNDEYIARAQIRFDEWQLIEKLRKIKEKYSQQAPALKESPETPTEEFAQAVRAQFNKLNLQSAYELAIGLQQMGLSSLALEALQSQKRQWTVREEVIEIEFLLAQTSFVEALSKSQEIIKAYTNNPEVLESCLYYSALAYYQLRDLDQAINILKGIQAHNPDYRNVAELIKIWEQEQ